MNSQRRATEDRFVEQMGLAAEQDRIPRIAGRIIGLLLIEEELLGIDEIATRLMVSRGSVSTNTRLLEGLGVVERVARPGDRRVYFSIAEAPGRKLLGIVTSQLHDRRRMIDASREAIARSKPVAAKRLEQLSRFYSTFARGIERILQDLDKQDEPQVRKART